MNALLIRVNEIALKGQNRGKFEDLLIRNIRRALDAESGSLAPQVRIVRSQNRVLAFGIEPAVAERVFARVFGVTGVNPLRLVESTASAVLAGALAQLDAHVARHGLPATFRVDTRRSDKVVAETSEELNRRIGAAALARYPALRVDLRAAELELGIEIRRERSFVWTESIAAPGGLPVGCNSPVLTLLSGGIDSPVAAIRMLRRGCPTSFVHFSGEPFVGHEPLEKVEDLARLANRYQPEPGSLVVVPFGKIQEEIALATQPKLRTILYRRMMFRIAGRIAERLGAHALVTGESLGQVASQTLDNLAVIDRASSLLVLRPLLGQDKEEIIREARRWGTYEASIRPGIDCCTLFADRHPAIRAGETAVQEQEKRFDAEALVERAVAGALCGGESFSSNPTRKARPAPQPAAPSGAARCTPSSSRTSSPALPPTS